MDLFELFPSCLFPVAALAVHGRRRRADRGQTDRIGGAVIR
jgi:hypothetical protein